MVVSWARSLRNVLITVICSEAGADGVQIGRVHSITGPDLPRARHVGPQENLVFLEKVPDISDVTRTVIDEPLKVTLLSCCACIQAVLA